MKLCVFPNDSILSYFQKGEIKERYFNPTDFFDEIHVISLFDEEIEEDKARVMAGKAFFKIHRLGKANLKNYKKFEPQVIELISKIKPSLIRAYNPLVQGWLATKAAKELKIPFVISLHTNYDQQKAFAKKKGDYFQYLKLSYASKQWEKFSLQNADAIICVYEFIVPYAKKMGGKNIRVVYNRVDLSKFSPNSERIIHSDKPIILSVGRLIDQKNHSYLIEAMKDLDANLLIIGDGPNFSSLYKLIQIHNLENKVKIIKKIPNEIINQYYVSCDIYAQPLENLGGIPIPVLEAMACGLPIVMSKRQDGFSEVIDDAVLFVENTADSFHNIFKKILSTPQIKEDLCKKSVEKIKEINAAGIEKKELEIYCDVIEKFNC